MNVERIIGPTLHDIGFLESQEIQPETKRLFNQFLKFFKRDSFYRQAIVNHHWNSVNGLTFPRTEVIYTNKTHHVKAHLSNTPKNKFIELRLHPLDSPYHPQMTSSWDISATIMAASDLFKNGWLSFFDSLDPAFTNTDFIQSNTLHARNGIEGVLQKLKLGSSSKV
jgi:hypothetical protein